MSSIFENLSDSDWCIPLTESGFSVMSSYVIKSMDYVCKNKCLKCVDVVKHLNVTTIDCM